MINYVDGKPFAADAMPVEHARCCGECYLWCQMSKLSVLERDHVLDLDQRGHLCTDAKFVSPARIEMYSSHHFADIAPPLQLAVDHYRECTYCYERPALEQVSGVIRTVTECSAPDGVFTEYEIEFPSGKIVIDDDLRDVFELPYELENSFADYNSALGQHQVVMAYAENGVAYGPVGNSCPGVYQVGTDKYQIATPKFNDDDDEAEDFPGTAVANVCTDLWAYSIMDYDLYRLRGGQLIGGWTRTVVDITPGTYRFKHHTGERTFDRDAEDGVIFADFERVS